MTYAEFRKRYQWNARTDKLGEGGFGKVYRATDTLRNRLVVLKIADVPYEHKFSLQREVELNRDLSAHPNIAQYRNCYRLEDEYGEEKDYATMDYFSEGSLTTVLKNHRLTDSDKRDIIIGMLQGLAHLEREKVIHRDFKPGNVLMARSDAGVWLPKIADFGLSRFSNSEATATNSSVGISYDYAAPEQFRVGSINQQADLWAAGVIVYLLLTGELPFAVPPDLTGESRRIELIRRIEQAQLPRRVNPIDEPYQTLIRRCLTKELSGRVKSAEELLALMIQPVVAPEPEPAPALPDRPHVVAEPLPVEAAPVVASVLVPVPRFTTDDSQTASENASVSRSDETPKRKGTRKNNKYLVWVLALAGICLVGGFYYSWQHPKNQEGKSANAFMSGALSGPAVPASELPARPVPAQFVNDFAGVLSVGERSLLEQKLATYSNDGTAQIALVVVKTTAPYAIKDYAAAIGNVWQIGKKNTSKGLVIVWANEDKKVFIATNNGAQRVLSDAAIDTIIRQIITPYFSKQHYFLGLNQAFIAIADQLGGEKPLAVLSANALTAPKLVSSPAGRVDEPISNLPKPKTVTPQEEPQSSDEVSSQEIVMAAGQQPEFPGGPVALNSYLVNNLHYPMAAQQANVSGRVLVSFVIDADGSLQDIQILKGIGFGADDEARRLVDEMPKWIPGRQAGKTVRVRYTLPIAFTPASRPEKPVSVAEKTEPIPAGSATGRTLRLSGGTEVLVALSQSVEAATAKEGQRVSLQVAKAVSVNGETLLPQGADVVGEVASVSTGGKKDVIEIRIRSIRGVGGQMVGVRSATFRYVGSRNEPLVFKAGQQFVVYTSGAYKFSL